MAKHRRLVAAARAKDEADEPEYIDRLEKKFHIQMHGKLSEQEALEFERAMDRMAPRYRDLLELIPDITFSTQPEGSSRLEVEGGHTTPHDRALHESVIDHEIAHAYGCIRIL